MDATLTDSPDALIRAVRCWQPRAVITGRAALRIQGLTELPPDAVDILLPYGLADRPRLRIHRGQLPGMLTTTIRDGPAATIAAACLFLGAHGDWDAVCLALRKNRVTPEEIRDARQFLTRRRGAAALDRVVRFTHDRPWSVAELEMHELLRLARITGWTGNKEVIISQEGERHRVSTRRYYLDGAFEDEMLDVEMKGRAYHDNEESFESDAAKIRAVTAVGWNVMPVTPSQMRRDPKEFLESVISRLHRRHRPVGLPRTIRYRPDIAGFWEFG